MYLCLKLVMPPNRYQWRHSAVLWVWNIRDLRRESSIVQREGGLDAQFSLQASSIQLGDQHLERQLIKAHLESGFLLVVLHNTMTFEN
ncbi:hypothetical protein ACH0BF_04530 [Pseudobacillus sp. 179-B 2D1 NHS]|uniref:hypothetical protein n=1 Tax=Pseudobacillus sp. 179-B 2D1 NHS TaxID=3374292 RepID=UPI003879E1B0